MTAHYRTREGATRPLALANWLAPATPGEVGVLRSLSGPVLDLGCGPGRLVVALAELGIPALGVDASAHAVQHARAAGAAVLRRSVFDPLPAEGRWASVLVFDGNVGIGGDPVALLIRIRALLAPGGQAVVEVEPRGTSVTSTLTRLERDGAATGWFPWAWVGAGAVDEIAASAGLRRIRWQVVDGRRLAVLERKEAR